jgi:TonB-linked SusC/RagA family outer membrane protein
MKNKLNIILWLSVFLLSLNVNSQNIKPSIKSKLTGTVIDKITKQPITGASVSIKGTTHTVFTDASGNFYFQTGQSFPYTLIVSYIGYKRIEINVNETPIEIVLEEENQQLDEIVVVGYGSQKKKDVTGSVASVSKISLSQISSSADNLLRGSVPGVVVTQSSGQPGASSSIRIRGGNSITGGNEPLYVIDGVLVYNDNNNGTAGVSLSGAGPNVLSTINPSDIESIDVLKDASATAIYGARGANGVIVITTKKGTRGQNRVSYEGYYGTQEVGKKIDLLNASQWATLRNDILLGLGQPASFTATQINDLKTGGYDWQSAAFRIAPIQNHQLTFSGGDEKSRYSISGNYYGQDGVIIGSNFKRVSFRANYEKNISDLFKIGLNATGSNSTYNGVSATSALLAPNSLVSVLLQSPVVPIRNADGTYNVTNNPYLSANNGYVANPINDLENTKNETVINRALVSVYGEYKLTKDLTAKSTVNADLIDTKQNYFAPSNTINGIGTKGLASVGAKFVNSILNENTLLYNKKINNNNQFSALVGYTFQHTKGEVVTAGSTNFVNDLTGYNALQNGTAVKPTSDAFESVLRSWLSRLNYSLLNRYNFTFTARADGSSRFGSQSRWGFFPSAGFSWNITEENFAKDVKGLDNLKLRLSVGTTGNQEIPDYLSLASLGSVNYTLGGAIQTGFTPTRLSNPDLKWEKTTQYNAGIDLGLLDRKINLVFDAYYKKTTDLLVDVPVPLNSGFTSVLQNIGAVENKGIEFGLSTENIKTNSFSWNSNIIFSKNNNKVLEIGNGVQQFFPTLPSQVLQLQQPIIVKVGEPLGTFWGYKTNGIFQSQQEIDSQPTLATKAATKLGDRKYQDISGPNGVPDGIISAAYDKVNLGSTQPKFVASFSNTFVYKNFDLHLFFQGVYGNKIFNALNQQLEIPSLGNNASAALANHWTVDNTNTDVARAASSPAAVVSDRFVEDGSFLRLKTITLGYTLPKSVANKIKSNNIKLYVSAQNLFTWTKYSGYDPEINSYGQSNLFQGVDYGAYPSSKTFITGLNVTF